MDNLVSFGNQERVIDQSIIALKKGTHLLKCGRKGKPKFCPFRLSNDGTTLMWISTSGERSLKLSTVSRIIPGQRTAVFQRYLRPEKDYLSFSLIYNQGKRSLDLICKDKVEAEVWISGIRALVSSGLGGRSKIDGWSDGGLHFDENRDLISNSRSDNSSVRTSQDNTASEASFSSGTIPSPKSHQLDNPVHSEKLHAALNQTAMQGKGSSSDLLRVSVSSAPSTSSHGSAPDDFDALGDVYIWGEVVCDNVVKIGPEKNVSSISTHADVLLPRLLESNVVLDVHHMACGVKHAALVTRQGEVFTWGEESGGRLGHGVSKDVKHPSFVESLSFSSVDFVACGEFHTCAVTMAGELYTWGDGTHNAGLLGHGTNACHWIPKRISGPLEGLQIAMVACGPWHTALITSTGQLFTFGDGTFGVLGHGDRENALYPREVESLSGLRTISVACGVWHTAAAVEVIVTQSSASISSGKLFTWGDGDKNRLGHGDKESRLEPTCVPALIDYNFHKVACGHSLTVGLTTSGHVFTMGSTVYGQLGNPQSDGKLPSFVEKLSGVTIEEISCGAYHVAVLTSRNEVYTWGKGANGRLGHGDIEDRKAPTLVEALKDRHVKFIACGFTYTAAICLHKWVSGSEQSQCSSCRQTFGFTRKRHNCYNCGLVHCHSCSSRKTLGAALAPNPSKPYRVCESCFTKLIKVAEAGANNKRNSLPRISGENKDRLDKADLRLAKLAPPSNLDLIKQLDSKAAKLGKKPELLFMGRSSQGSSSSQGASSLQLKDVLSNSGDIRWGTPKPTRTPSGFSSRSVSPFSRKPSPPRSKTPIPTAAGLSFSKGASDSLKKSNELLNLEVQKLRSQVESLKQRCDFQEAELQRSTKKTEEAVALATEESAKCKAAKEVIKSLTAQLKDMAARLPPGVFDTESIKPAYQPNGLEPNGVHSPNGNGERHLTSDSIPRSSLVSNKGMVSDALRSSEMNEDSTVEGISNPNGSGGIQESEAIKDIECVQEKENHSRSSNSAAPVDANTRSSIVSNNGMLSDSLRSSVMNKDSLVEGVLNPNGSGGVQESEAIENREGLQEGENGVNANQIEAEWIEQYDQGVYITLVALTDGTTDLRRVRFSRRRFVEHQAATWWSENREKVYERYNIRGSDKSSVIGQTAPRSGVVSPSPQI